MNDYLSLEQQVPIDIHVNKLKDWLISRKICKNDPDLLIKLELLKKELIFSNDFLDLNFYKELFLCNNEFHYQDLKNFYNKHKNEIKQSKAIKKLLDFYEKDSLFLYDNSKYLATNNQYGIPSLKQELNQIFEIFETYQKRTKEYIDKSKFYTKEFDLKCQEIKIKGTNVSKELINSLQKLPLLFEILHKKLVLVNDAFNYYNKYRILLNNFSNELPQSTFYLPTLQKIYDEKEDLYPENYISNQAQANSCGIELIDEGEEIMPQSAIEEDQDHMDMSQLKEARNFYISRYVVCQKKFRQDLISNLRELNAFLKQRNKEKESEKINETETTFFNLAKAQMLQKSGDSPFYEFSRLIDEYEKLKDGNWVEELEIKTSQALMYLTKDGEFTNALLVLNDESYVERLCETLYRFKALSKQMLASSKDFEAKVKETSNAITKKKEELRNIYKTNQVLRDRIQRDISQIYNNRRVNIIGLTFA